MAGDEGHRNNADNALLAGNRWVEQLDAARAEG